MEDFLNHMIAEVSKQHQVLEKECNLLKDLLKPWPTKKKVLDNSEDKQRLTTTQEVQDVSETFSHEERQTLSEIEKLLQKAEKTRHLKSKVKHVVDDGTNLVECSTNKTDLTSSHESKHSDSPVPNSSSVSNGALDMKRNGHKSSTRNVPSPNAESSIKQTSEIKSSQPKRNPTKRQPENNAAKTEPDSNQIKRQLENSTTKRLHNTKNSSSTITVNSKDARQKSNRPLSSHQPSSIRARYVPAHMLAPFKTSDNIAFPKRKNIYLPNHKGSQKVAPKTSMQVKTYKTLPEITPGEYKRSVQTSDTKTHSMDLVGDSEIGSFKDTIPASHCINNNTDFPEDVEPADHIPQHISTMDSNSNCSSLSNLETTCEHSTRQSNIHLHSCTIDQPPQTLHEARSDYPECELQQFNLQKNGYQALNRALQEAGCSPGNGMHCVTSLQLDCDICTFLSDTSVFDRKDVLSFNLQENDSSLKLPSKLVKLVNENRSVRNRLSTSRLVKKVSAVDPGQQFVDRLCGQEEISNELRTRVSALTCWRSHQILLDVLQNCQLDQLSESTSMEVLYRTKRTLEFVLTTFAELRAEADYFSEVKYRELSKVSDKHNIQRNQQKALWLDTGQHTVIPDDIREHLQTSKSWTHLLFTEKYLQLNIFLVNAAQAEWWKILTEDRDPTVLQGVYGLLTTHGQFLPALVVNPDLE